MMLSLTKLFNETALLSSLELLRKISSMLNTSCDSRSLFQTIVKELALNLALDGCIVLAIDKQRQNAIVQAHYNRYPWSQESCGDQLTLERYPALVEAVRTATIKEVHSLPFYTGAQGQSSLDRVVDMCCSLILPLVSTGKVIGLLVCQNVHLQIRFTKKETLLLETATELITNALERAKSQLKEDAFGMLAHDLRSPLLMVVRLMGLSMQGLYGPLTSEQHQLFSELKDHCDLLLGLMNDILDMRSYEAGTLVLRKTVTEIPKLIHQSVRLLQFAIADQDIRIETHFGSDVSSLVVDEKRIVRVLINLLDNAIRFSPSGEKVVLQCSRLATGEVLITVNDAGSGIHQENQQHIFDKFYPVGTGLGLAFCRETVQAHGGRIWVESPLNERGGGSRFCFTLPCGATREGIGCSEVAGNS